MMNFVKYSWIILLVVFVNTMFSQNGMVLYQLTNVQQANYLNPAFDTKYNLNIGIPGLSSNYIKITNTFFQPNNLFSTNKDQTVFNKNNYLKSLKDFNYFGTQASFELFSLAKKIKSGTFSFSIRERIDARLVLPKDFLAFPMTGNANFDLIGDDNLDFSGLAININHYREFNLGLQKNITPYLSVGGRVKLIYGYENVDFEKSEIIWKTNPESWDWEIEGQIEINTSGIIPDSTSSNTATTKEYIFKRKNRGIGLDLGINYELTDRTSLSAALVDFGYIEWKNEVNTTRTNEANFVYTGLEISEDIVLGNVSSDSIGSAKDQLIEDFKSAFSYENDDNPYKTWLVANLNLGAKYKINSSANKESSMSFYINSEFYKKRLNPSFGLSYQQRFSKHFNTVATYSIQNGDFKNLGLGLAANFGVFQFYTSMDNVLAVFTTPIQFGDSGGAIPFPSFSKNSHIHFGMNLAFPQSSRRRGKLLQDNVGGISGNEGYRKPQNHRTSSRKRKKRRR